MKKIAPVVCVLMLAVFAYSQTTHSNPTLTKQDYLKKSKNKKTTGLIILGTGVALTATAFLIPRGDVTHISFWNIDYENDRIRNVFGSTGVLFMLGSIPFYIMASKNKKKAAAISLNMENVPALSQQQVHHSYPSLSINISLQ